MKEFIFTGLMMTICGGWLFGCMFTCEMKKPIPHFIVATIISLIIGFSIGGLITLDNQSQRKDWNSGLCAKCGEEWEFQCATKGRGISSTTYYYICKNGHIIKTSTLFEK